MSGAPEGPDDPETKFSVRLGDVVEVHGLSGATHHNGQIGHVSMYLTERERFSVRLPALKKPLAVRAGNLRKHGTYAERSHTTSCAASASEASEQAHAMNKRQRVAELQQPTSWRWSPAANAYYDNAVCTILDQVMQEGGPAGLRSLDYRYAGWAGADPEGKAEALRTATRNVRRNDIKARHLGITDEPGDFAKMYAPTSAKQTPQGSGTCPRPLGAVKRLSVP